jgi:hypothetical protein
VIILFRDPAIVDSTEFSVACWVGCLGMNTGVRGKRGFEDPAGERGAKLIAFGGGNCCLIERREEEKNIAVGDC